MMEDSFWDFLIYGGVATGVYMWGKKAGVDKAMTEYTLQAQLADQQKKINDLTDQLNTMKLGYVKNEQG